VTGQPIAIEDLTVDGVPCKAARPLGQGGTGVIVLHQAPGYSPQIADWLQRLAAEGHLAIAPLLLHHRGEEAVDPFTRFDGDLAAFTAFLPGDDEVRGDVDAALGFLRESGVEADRTGILGFSYGGRAAFRTATEYSLGGAITFYGNGIQNDGYPGNDGAPSLADRVPHLRTPWLGLYGDQDFLLAEGELDDLEASLRNAPAFTELVRYPTAGHAFDVDMSFGPGAPSTLHPDVAEDASERTRSFLRTRLSGNRTAVDLT
jgi:carboxymethylenebutenolidase